MPDHAAEPSPAAPGAVTEIYGLVRWEDEELSDDFVILRTFTRRHDAESLMQAFQEREPDNVFNVVVLHR
jgi:hypothetical protein